MTIRSADLRSKANIFAIAKESELWDGRVVLFDKTETKWVSVFLKTNQLEGSRIEVIEAPYHEELVETITKWGAIQPLSQQEWVQVLAEDDCFIGLEEPQINWNPQISMLICPILYLYKKRSYLENQNVFEPGLSPKKVCAVFKNGQIIADSGWHALIRTDAFTAYSKWVNLLPIKLWHTSNQGIWSAMFFGNIGTLSSFHFIKEHEHWRSPEVEQTNMKRQYLRLFGNEDLYIWDFKLYWLGCMANFFFLQKNYPAHHSNDILLGILRHLVSRPRLRHFLALKSIKTKSDYILNWMVSKSILFKLRLANFFQIKVDNRTYGYRIFKREIYPLPQDFQRLITFYDSVISANSRPE
jgi:hypothetical protein